MIHIRSVSDLHLEFYYDLYDKPLALAKEQLKTLIPPLPTDKKTVLIVAGDLATARRAGRIVTFLELVVPRFAHTIYVLGNHEHYNGDIDTSQQLIEEAIAGSTAIDSSKLTIAGNSMVKYQHKDVTFLCATLWTNYRKLDPMSIGTISRYITDHKVIKKGKKPFRTFDGYNIFQATVAQLREELADKDNSKTIIVTHHMPTYQAVHPMYMMDETTRLLNGAFASDLDDFIMEHQPAYWFFGHTHTQYRGEIGKTRLVCNPLGYPNENNLTKKEFKTNEVFSL